jgi:hypothetical protein
MQPYPSQLRLKKKIQPKSNPFNHCQVFRTILIKTE